MNKLITFRTDKSGITIRIPKDLLVFVAENHPTYPIKVLDKQAFMEEVAQHLEHDLPHNAECNEDSKFESLIDEACQAVYEDGSESIDFTYPG